MPTYTFQDKTTGEVWEEIISISDRDLKVQDPNIQQLIVKPLALSYSPKSIKPDSGFRDVLKQIKNNNYGSNINTF